MNSQCDHRGCFCGASREEALSDAQWWHPTGLRYQRSAGGRYQPGDAPPTAGDPLITSHTTWTGLRHNTLLPHKPSLQTPYPQTVSCVQNLQDSNRVEGPTVSWRARELGLTLGDAALGSA